MQARAIEIFQRVVDLNAEQRTAALDEACSSDVDLRRQVEALLARDAAAATDFLEPKLSMAASTKAPDWESIGDYRVVRQIGTGGMGIVYEAVQANPQRRVALKLLQGPSTEVSARFEREAEVLGRLQHPGIAHVYEAGTATAKARDGTVTQRQFLAMEFVPGVDLGTYLRTSPPPVPERLALLAEIADAAHHAHEQGVVHRDLKPDNIMVSTEGRPKILDFGVARVLGTESRAVPTMTVEGQVVGTLAFMSPEQARGDLTKIGPTTDVYGLGALMYYVLTLRAPFDFEGHDMASAARTLVDEDPLPLTTQVSSDVNTILVKAMAKDPQRRYRSAAALAHDLRLYLAAKPILARPPSIAYRATRFVRRHRALAASGLIVITVLTIATALSMAWAQREASAREKAETSERSARRALAEAVRQQHRARAMHDFLLNVLKSPDTRSNTEPNLTVADALEQARLSVGAHFRADAALAASARVAIADTLASLARHDAAASLLAEAVEDLRDPSTPEQHRALGEAWLVSSDLALLRGNHDRVEHALDEVDSLGEVLEDSIGAQFRARALLTRAQLAIQKNEIEKSERLLDEVESLIQTTQQPFELATTTRDTRTHVALLRGDLATAETNLTAKLTEIETRYDGDHPDLIEALAGLGAIQFQRQRFELSAKTLHRAIELSRRFKGAKHPSLGILLQNLAVTVRQTGQLDEAGRLYREALDILVPLFGNEHPQVIHLRSNVARLEEARGRLDPAIQQYRTVLTAQADVHPGDHLLTAQMLYNLAHALTRRNGSGDLDEADGLHERALAMRKRLVGDTHALVASSLFGIARLAEARGDHERAHATWQKTVAMRRATTQDAAHDSNLAAALESLGICQQRRGEKKVAASALREALAIYRATTPDDKSKLDALAQRLERVDD